MNRDCCKPDTAKLYRQSTMKLAFIEWYRLRRLALAYGGGPCLNKFEWTIRKSTRTALTENRQSRLRSFAARLHWRASPTERKPTKAASASGSPAFSGALRHLPCSRDGHSRPSIITPACQPEATWRRHAKSGSA